MSNLKVNQVTADAWFNQDGTENYKCRAWCLFDGGTAPLGLFGSGNVSSLVDNGVGNYTINFIKEVPHDNYAVLGSAVSTGSTWTGARIMCPEGTSKAASHNKAWVRIGVVDNNSDAHFDANRISLAIVG